MRNSSSSVGSSGDGGVGLQPALQPALVVEAERADRAGAGGRLDDQREADLGGEAARAPRPSRPARGARPASPPRAARPSCGSCRGSSSATLGVHARHAPAPRAPGRRAPAAAPAPPGGARPAAPPARTGPRTAATSCCGIEARRRPASAPRRARARRGGRSSGEPCVMTASATPGRRAAPSTNRAVASSRYGATKAASLTTGHRSLGSSADERDLRGAVLPQQPAQVRTCAGRGRRHRDRHR